MVYGTQITIVTGANLNQLITGGPHIVCIYIYHAKYPWNSGGTDDQHWEVSQVSHKKSGGNPIFREILCTDITVNQPRWRRPWLARLRGAGCWWVGSDFQGEFGISTIKVLVGFQTLLLFSISYMGCHPSHWRTPSFFKMVETTNQMIFLHFNQLKIGFNMF